MKIIDREKIISLEDLPNVGSSIISKNLKLIGIYTPEQLINQNPIQMYKKLCNITDKQHDLCLLDVFISITEFMNGKEAKHWWAFTSKRKEMLKKHNLN